MDPKRITELDGIDGDQVAADDVFVLVDISDPTMAVSGTTKKIRADEATAAMRLVSRIRTMATDDTAGYNDHLILADANFAPIAITLPDATLAGIQMTIKKIDGSGNTVTLVPNGVQLIENDTALVISFQGDAATVTSDGTAWWLV